MQTGQEASSEESSQGKHAWYSLVRLSEVICTWGPISQNNLKSGNNQKLTNHLGNHFLFMVKNTSSFFLPC